LAAAAGACARPRAVAHHAALAHREARATTELGFAVGYQDLDETTLLAARAQAGACGAPETEAVADNTLAALAATRAEPGATVEYADAGLALARRYRLGQLVPALLIEKAVGLALRGDTDAMEAVLAEAEPLARGEPMEEIALLAQARATCAFAVDDLRAAAAHLDAAAEVARRARPTVIPPMLVMSVLVRTLAGADPRPLAAELDGWQTDASPWRLGILAAAEGVHGGREGHPTDPPADVPADTPTGTPAGNVDRALRALEPAPFLQAVVARLVATAPGSVRWGDPQRWLTIAETRFCALGLPAPAEACRAAIARQGRRGDELSSREEEVLALVADGLANRAIAAALHLSVRTVEKHLERLLAKTGSVNRAQLATYAVRRGG
jgi:DNA-binding CsgD family transcriptional regulator